MFVRMLETQKFGKRSYSKGKIYDIDDVQAADWIKTGQAARATEAEVAAAQKPAAEPEQTGDGDKSKDDKPKAPAKPGAKS